MKNYRLTIGLIFICLHSLAQNLVLNPGFEQYTVCPTAPSQIGAAVGWTSSSYSPDYYNTCSASLGVPSNGTGFQYPASGNAYAGGFCFGAGSMTYIYPNLREWLTGTLTQPLSIGQKYFVSFKVVLSDVSSFAANKLGARFLTSAGAMNFKNQAHIFSTTIITNPVNWTLVSGSFVADSNYTFISIGNHFADSLTDTLRVRPIWDNSFNAYYLFDDVCVSQDSLYSMSFVTSLAQYPEPEERLFPNPFTHEINVSMDDGNVYTIILYDVFSKPLLRRDFTGSVTISTQPFPQGIYFYEIKDKAGAIAGQGKLMKE